MYGDGHDVTNFLLTHGIPDFGAGPVDVCPCAERKDEIVFCVARGCGNHMVDPPELEDASCWKVSRMVRLSCCEFCRLILTR